MSVSSARTPEDWILEQLGRADDALPPAALLMPDDPPADFDSVSIQFAFWRLLSDGSIKFNQNRSVSLTHREMERHSGDLAPS